MYLWRTTREWWRPMRGMVNTLQYCNSKNIHNLHFPRYILHTPRLEALFQCIYIYLILITLEIQQTQVLIKQFLFEVQLRHTLDFAFIYTFMFHLINHPKYMTLAASKSLIVCCFVGLFGYIGYNDGYHHWAQFGGKPGTVHNLQSMTTTKLLYNYDSIQF